MRIQVPILLCIASILVAFSTRPTFAAQGILVAKHDAPMMPSNADSPSTDGTSIRSNDEGKPEQAKCKPGQIVVSTVVEGLDNPFSVAIEQASDRIFVAESGAQRIVEIKDGKAIEIADGFDAQDYLGYKAGPISLCSPAANVLLVGHDSKSAVGSLTMLKFTPNAEDADKTDVKRETVQIATKDGGLKLNTFSNITVKHSVIYVVTRGDEDNGWVAIAEFKDEKVAALRPSIATAKLSNYTGPTCSTVSPGGEYLVISQMGKEGAAKDSRLCFYTLQGKLLHNFEVELHDVVSLAYSPIRKHLFAIDHHFADPSKATLQKLISSGAEKCEAKKLQDLPYATSMAFDSKGDLYVTTLGGPPATDGTAKGKLIKIEGLDDQPIELMSENENESKEDKS